MTVVATCKEGWLLDHEQLINDVFRECYDVSGSVQSFKVRDGLFAINNQFVMDSQFNKHIKETCEHHLSVQKSKKRKRKCDLNDGELLALDYHRRVSPCITHAFDAITTKGRELGCFSSDQACSYDNNQKARSSAAIEGPDLILSTIGQEDKIGPAILKTGDNLPQTIHNRLIHYDGDKSYLVNSKLGQYILPPQSTFLMSDISGITTLVSHVKYNVIVVDPPWVNKSVKRKKMYYTLKESELVNLPIKELAAPGCLVVVWVTNKQKQQTFVKEELFPRWSVHMKAEWYWLKVTRFGKPVYDIDSPHKKPYEAVLVGRFESHDAVSTNTPPIPDSKVIVSVPCAIHSRKPLLAEILSGYVPAESKFLELFARNLTPSWTSWGNEVLKYQHTDFFEQLT